MRKLAFVARLFFFKFSDRVISSDPCDAKIHDYTPFTAVPLN